MHKQQSHLQAWMQKHKKSDAAVAKKIGISRVQVGRIRRNKSGTTKTTALRLAKLTKIAWHRFLEGASR